MQPTRSKRHTKAESKQMEKVCHAIGKKEKAGVVILMSDKIEFKDYNKKHRGHNDQRSIQEEDATLKNTYLANIGEPKYIKHTLTYIKGEIDNNTSEDFNSPLTSMDRKPTRKY